MTRGRTKKSDKIPKYGDIKRKFLLQIIPSLEVYKNTLEKGLPVLFTGAELEQLKDKYKDGITWNEVDRELSQKGIPLEKVTFRKYIQDRFLSKATSYRNTDTGRVAVFPPDTIENINFINFFFKAADKKQIESILNLLPDGEATYLEAVESRLESGRNIYAAILHYICFDDNDVYEAIHEALSTRPKVMKAVLKKLAKIDRKFQAAVDPEIRELISFLEGESIPLVNVMTETE